MIPLTGVVAGEVSENNGGKVKATFFVMYDNEILDGTVITATLCERNTTSGTLLGTTSNGMLELEAEASAVTGKDVVVEFSLPTGYEFQFDSPQEDKSKHSVGYRAEDIFSENGCSIGFPVTNPSRDGKLEIETTYITAAIGDVIDISGAFDLNSQVFPLYYTDIEGNRTRVVCDYTVTGDGVYREENHKLTIYEAGYAQISFYYKNTSATLTIRVPGDGDANENENETDAPDGQFEAIANYKDQPLNGVKITVSVKNSEDEETGHILETSITGKLVFTLPKEEIKQYKYLCVTYELPEGYEELESHDKKVTSYL